MKLITVCGKYIYQQQAVHHEPKDFITESTIMEHHSTDWQGSQNDADKRIGGTHNDAGQITGEMSKVHEIQERAVDSK